MNFSFFALFYKIKHCKGVINLQEEEGIYVFSDDIRYENTLLLWSLEKELSELD